MPGRGLVLEKQEKQDRVPALGVLLVCWGDRCISRGLVILVNVGGTPIPVQGEDQRGVYMCADVRGRFHET